MSHRSLVSKPCVHDKEWSSVTGTTKFMPVNRLDVLHKCILFQGHRSKVKVKHTISHFMSLKTHVWKIVVESPCRCHWQSLVDFFHTFQTHGCSTIWKRHKNTKKNKQRNIKQYTSSITANEMYMCQTYRMHVHKFQWTPHRPSFRYHPVVSQSFRYSS